VVVGQGPDASPILWKPVVWKEAEVITSRVTLGEFPRAIAMMERGLLHPDLLITHTLPLDRVAEAYGVSQDAGADSVKVLVRVGG
jgi:L-gulonate 5-dehydrogenase